MATITALMTTYNSAAHVEETINSILNQTFEDFEFLIVDDGSTDNTVAIIKNYQDKRIHLIEHSDNQGVGARLSKALELVNTPYIAKVDSDDISHPQRFEKQLAYLQANPQLDIIKCLFEYFPDNDAVAQSERYRQSKAVKEKEHNAINTPELISEHLPRWNCIIHTTYFAKTAVIKTVGYPEQRIGEDYSLFYRALAAGYMIGCLQEYLIKMRISDFSVTTQSGTSDYFMETLIPLKQKVLEALYTQHQGFWIYGTGGLGRATCKALIKEGYTIKGFLTREKQANIVLDDGHEFPVKNIESSQAKGILVAAQPVRAEICQLLQKKGFVEHQDFMVIA